MSREEEIRDGAILAVAREIALTIRTAPKTTGRDKLTILVADGGEVELLADAMAEICEQASGKRPKFGRDAGNVRAARAVILVGVKPTPFGLDCGFCGYRTCAEKPENIPCAFGSIDLGIGAGVAASLLGQRHVDNRVMFSLGYAAMRLGMFPPEVTQVLGIPLSVSGKNIFFDRP